MPRAVVKRWGNSASVRIPAAMLKAVRLEVDDAVELREESGRIVIEPLLRKDYKLAKLIKGITAKNQHSEVQFGPPVGKESL